MSPSTFGSTYGIYLSMHHDEYVNTSKWIQKKREINIKNLCCINRIEGDEYGGKDPTHGTLETKIDFSVDSNIESNTYQH